MFNDIYLKALAEPAIGFKASHKFTKSVNKCPLCGSLCWIRLRRGSRVGIGVTCEKCPWVHPYTVAPSLPPQPYQPDLRFGQERPPREW